MLLCAIMADFYRDVLVPAMESDKFIAKTGGLPEISRASSDLAGALEQTRQEIKTAEFAQRYPRYPSDYFLTMLKGGRESLTPRAQQAIDNEGEAGYKRESLIIGVEKIEAELCGLIQRLVELRCDLHVSQQEF